LAGTAGILRAPPKKLRGIFGKAKKLTAGVLRRRRFANPGLLLTTSGSWTTLSCVLHLPDRPLRSLQVVRGRAGEKEAGVIELSRIRTVDHEDLRKRHRSIHADAVVYPGHSERRS
jgi:hypothetical protein